MEILPRQNLLCIKSSPISIKAWKRGKDKNHIKNKIVILPLLAYSHSTSAFLITVIFIAFS